MYSYSYYHGPNPVVTVILFLIALVGGVCAYLMFVKSDEEPKDPRLVKLKEFLSFKKMIIEGLLKITYIVFALFITLYSFQIMVGTSFITGLMLLILLNIMLRIGYEASLIVLLIWRNTSDINKKLGKSDLVEEIKEGLEATGLESENEAKTSDVEANVKVICGNSIMYMDNNEKIIRINFAVKQKDLVFGMLNLKKMIDNN